MLLSDISVRKPVMAWMLMAGLIFFGAISFHNMGISQLPDVDFPVVSVTLTYEGAAPEVMEVDIVDVVEDAVMTVQGVRNVSSYSRYGRATVSIEFELNRDIDVALQEVQTKITQVQRNLPKDMDPPVITKTNPEDQPILWISLSSTSHTHFQLMQYVRDQLKQRFTTVDGVGEIMLGGYVDPNLRVWVSNRKLNQYELTVGDILDTVQNEHSELPAGQIETERKEYDVRTMGEARTIAEFENIVINERGGQPNFRQLHLKQVASIEEGLEDIRRVSRFNGEPAVGLGVQKQRGTNAVAVARNVKQRIDEVSKILPTGMSLRMTFDSTRFIEDSVGELNFTLILSALLTALVCWLFLGSWSSTANILLAIPTSIIGAFTILFFCGFTLNTFTLLGLTLAVGIVVDDAIMVLENIVRHQELGKSKRQAALDGAREITFAAIAATTAIVTIFLPVAFMRGVVGKFFLQFGVTITVTVILSLLEAITLTPMRCSQFVSSVGSSAVARTVNSLFQKLASSYRSLLIVALRHRGLVVGGALVFFAISFASVSFLNKEFVPAQDQGVFIIRLETPIDSSIQYTDAKVRMAEAFLQSRPEVSHAYAAIGGFHGGDVNSAIMFVTMKPFGKNGRHVSQQEFMNTCRQELGKISDLKVFLLDLSMRGFTASRGYPIEFSVRGPNWDDLGNFSSQIMKHLGASGLVTDLDTDYKLGKPEIQIIPNRDRAAEFGVSIRVISETIRALIGGVVSGKYAMGGHRYDIRVRLEPDERGQAEQIKSLWVRNNRGELVRLADVVQLVEKPSLQQIARYGRERAITIFANVAQGQSQAKVLAEVNRISSQVLPDNYHIIFSGSAQTFRESFQDLLFALMMGILVAYMVLAAQFNSYIDPITVLLTLPFSVSGALLGLLLAHQSLNIYSFIGLILLMGIVKKNSILLVEFTNQVRAGGEISVREALLRACPIRLRPILMTSFATIAGAIPPALALGPGAETRIPMAVAVLGGVLVSTLLTLLVVPCVYSLFRERGKANDRSNHLADMALVIGTSSDRR